MGFVIDKGVGVLIGIAVEKLAPNVPREAVEKALGDALDMVETMRQQMPAVVEQIPAFMATAQEARANLPMLTAELIATRDRITRMENKLDAIFAHLLLTEDAKGELRAQAKSASLFVKRDLPALLDAPTHPTSSDTVAPDAPSAEIGTSADE